MVLQVRDTVAIMGSCRVSTLAVSRNEGRKEKEQRDFLGLSVEDWILALIAYAGGKLEGATRLQKGLFLIRMEAGLVPADFEPGDYGPFSVDVANGLRKLVDEKGLIIEEEGNWGDEAPARVFRLTPEGKERGEEVLDRLKKSSYWGKIDTFLRMATKYPLMRLLVIVYNWYPEYSKVSKIRRKVDYWTRRLFFDLRSRKSRRKRPRPWSRLR